jgi:transposase-like protein
MTKSRTFRGFRFPAEVIFWAVRWYLQFPVSYRDLEAMLADRGVVVDHTTMYRWVQRFAPELEQRVRRHLRPRRGPWHVDETYLRIDGQWRYLYRAVDGRGQTIDFRLSAKRDKQAAKRFFRQALGREHTRNPREIITDRLKTYPGAVREMKRDRGVVALHAAPPRPLAQQPGRARSPAGSSAEPGRCSALGASGRRGGPWPAWRRWRCWPRDRCALSPGTTSRRSGPLSIKPSASPPDRKETGRRSPAASQRNGTLSRACHAA